jgi:chromosome segregation ATPase
MQDRPSAGELAEAVREFLEEEILPDLDDPRARFRTRVAMNALSILERELEQEEGLLREELARLADLLGKDPATPDSLEKLRERIIELNRDLARNIRQGEAPEGTLEHLKQTVADKLKIASPRYLERYD